LASDKELSDFLKSVEKRAFKRTVYAVRDDDAALDIVQDTMIRLAEKYFDRPAAELPLLFTRILSNATMDWFRRQKVRNNVLKNFSDFEGPGQDGDFDILEILEAQDGSVGSESAADSVSRAQILLTIDTEVNAKPSCCVTGRNLMLPRRLLPWAAPKAVSRRIARGRCGRWQQR
jgi:RNA polymerase sigma-70 factor, ECF subfamily